MVLTPITREEYYLAKLGGQDVATPEPVTRIETYLDIICGNSGEILTPITRVEFYLARIAGADVLIPTPILRSEYYLAAIAGEEIDVPEPITRLEHFMYEWLNSGSSGTLVTVTGVSPLALVNALAKPIKSLTQFGKCVQNGTPTPDSPVDILCNNGALRFGVTGKNIFNESTEQSGRLNDDGTVTASSAMFVSGFFSVKPSTAYTLSYISGSQNQYRRLCGYSSADEQDFTTLLRKINKADGGDVGEKVSFTFTTDASTLFVRLSAWFNDTEIQIEEGQTATIYEPYTEGIYTDGTSEVLTVSGINLLDPSTSNIKIGQQVTASGEITTAYPNNWRSDYIPVVGGKTYAFWGRAKADDTISAYNRINWYTADKTNISPRPSYTVDTVTVGTAPSNAAFAMLSCSCFKSDAAITRENFDEFNWMFAETSAEIPYQPYVTPQTVSDISMLLGVGNYKDEAELISGLLTHNVGIKVLDGTEGWREHTAAYSTLLEYADINAGDACICTHYIGAIPDMGISGQPNMSAKAGYKNNPPNDIRLYIKDSSFATINDFTAFLAAQYANGTPVIVLYPLAEETTEQTTAHSLHSYNGTTIVDATSEVAPVNLSAEYIAEVG